MRGLGTTSACAENTPRTGVRSSNPGNYLRVRGEYFTALMRCRSTSELPPRARRIHLPAIPEGDDLGTTSACAENTPFCLFIRWGVRNYLRVRGEYTPPAKWCGWSRELPPRARRIHLTSRFDRHFRGTTSACAENTHGPPTPHPNHRNYLRVRGEYIESWTAKRWIVELPPRARRILPLLYSVACPGGTTSACAENTAHPLDAARLIGNYLRVRGEYLEKEFIAHMEGELPPRARRIHVQKRSNFLIGGTTSACAENTHQHLAHG